MVKNDVEVAAPAEVIAVAASSVRATALAESLAGLSFLGFVRGGASLSPGVGTAGADGATVVGAGTPTVVA